MFQSIIEASLRAKLVVLLLIAGLIGWGLFSLQRIPLDAVPDITNNQVQIITLCPSLAAQEVEQYMTTPLEISLANLPGVEEIRSISRSGLSVITVVFGENEDLYRCRQIVGEQLRQVEGSLPTQYGSPELGPVSTGLGEIYQYVLTVKPGYEDRFSPQELRTLQDWQIKRQLAGIPGVIDISGFGGELRQYEVALDPRRLQSYNLSLAEVYAALAANNANTGGAYIEKGPMSYYIRGEGAITRLEDIAQIRLKNQAGVPLTLAQVGEVRLGNAVRYGALTHNGQGETVGGIVMMLKGANSAQVIERVKERMEVVKASLPEGLEIHPFLDRSKLVKKAIKTVSTNLLEGGLIVIFVLVLLLGNWRAGLVAASVIPLSMLFALGMMDLFGVSANLMSLGALDFGLVVDGAVIVVESIVHYLHSPRLAGQRLNQGQMDEAVRLSSTKIRKSAAFGEIIILIVYMPVLVLVGIEGKMFKPMAQTVSFAILGALLLSLTWVPVISSLVLSKKASLEENFSDRLMNRIRASYRPVLTWALRHTAWVLGLALVLLASAGVLFSRMGGEFLPTLDEGDLALEVRLMPGTSIAQTVKTCGEIERRLLTLPEVKEVVSKIGTAEIPTDPMPFEAADVMVILSEPETWGGKTKAELIEEMESLLSDITEASIDFQQPIEMRFNELMTGIKSDVAIKIYGDNLDTLFHLANHTAGLIQKVDGVSDVKVEQVTGQPFVRVQYNRAALARYGVDVEEVNQVLRTGFAGESAGLVYEGDRRFALVARLQADFRQEPEQVNRLLVRSHSGTLIPLSELVTLKLDEGPAQVSRENTRRRIYVGLNVRDRDVESLVAEVSQRLGQNLRLPPGYQISYGGQFENLQAAKDRLAVAVPVALLLIFVILYLTFHSLRDTLLIYTAIPLSAIGGVLALVIRGMPFSISAGVGFIALFGVAVLNGVVLISYLKDLRQNGQGLYRALLASTDNRLRPVLMTALVGSLGFLPMALSQSAGAEVQKPLATVVIGGIASATLLTLVVLPVLYAWVHSREWRKEKGLVSVLVLSLLGISAGSVQAQSSASLTELQALAREKSPYRKALRLETQAVKALERSSFEPGRTVLDYARGQTQYSGQDYTFQISQAFELPGAYAAYKRLAESRTRLQASRQGLLEAELDRALAYAAFQAEYQKRWANLLDRRLQGLSQWLNVQERRAKAGESSQTEVLLARNQHLLVEQAWKQAQKDQDIALADLNRLIADSAQRWQPRFGDAPVDSLPRALTLPEHPMVLSAQALVELSERSYQAERKKYNPYLNLGYARQSVEGIDGLQFVSGGLSIPLFFGAQKARLKSLETQQQAARFYLASQTWELEQSRRKSRLELEKWSQTWQELSQRSQQLLPDLQTKLNQQLSQGEIDYLQLIQLEQGTWALQEQLAHTWLSYGRAWADYQYWHTSFTNSSTTK